MDNEPNLYRQAIIDNFSVINIGDAVLSFQKDVYENDGLSKNLAFRFDDSSNQEKINLYIVVTFDFRFSETIERFIEKLKESIIEVKKIQLKQDCVYILPIATNTEAVFKTYDSFKKKFEGEEVFCLP